MNILLFGGSFNPPHLGHRLVIEQAFELIPQIDEVWLLPCYSHTFQKELAPAADRLAMCRLLAKEISLPIKICPIEIDYHTSGSTYQTLQLLQSESAYLHKTMHLSPTYHVLHTTYAFLIGSDQLPVFTKWQHWQLLLKAMTFYVYPRAGYPLTPTYPGMVPLTSATQVITNLSSTLVRERFLKHQSVVSLLPPAILRYITSCHLYQT